MIPAQGSASVPLLRRLFIGLRGRLNFLAHFMNQIVRDWEAEGILLNPPFTADFHEDARSPGHAEILILQEFVKPRYVRRLSGLNGDMAGLGHISPTVPGIESLLRILFE